ncbi:hypothetical protein IFM46972_04225 [Aspergillus udagawae]|uniref:Uncharacterized protein n=1 Tax=Aspergillus udagawae TaxID=91492 RepID=A0A8H3RP70_9EURO|nr:hypothetical protein IFM46972_04225 [Aspergillus udagawae]
MPFCSSFHIRSAIYLLSNSPISQSSNKLYKNDPVLRAARTVTHPSVNGRRHFSLENHFLRHSTPRPESAPMSAIESTRFELPGLTLPLYFRPHREWTDVVYANALDETDIENGYVGYMFTLRELSMMRIMEAITDKPDWDKKVFNQEITDKWRKEISDSGQDITERMIEYIFAELRWKSTEYKKTGILTSYDPGVVKSDVAIPKELKQQLRDLVKPLEDVPEEEKDYHPGSDDKVVDLVHPSLFPLVYGRTKVLGDKLIGLDDCFLYVGQGEMTRISDSPPERLRRMTDHDPYSRHFQWLPCEVKFNGNGECQIASYINNLHPAKHRDLYHVIEKILTQIIPLWNISLTRDYNIPRRIQYNEVEYLPSAEPEPQQGDDESDDDAFYERLEEWRDARRLKQPEPAKFEPPTDHRQNAVDLQSMFAKEGLQVIVKLANIELTPEEPEYEGGSWHIEGQLNERICATAIYYYDSQNITDNTLSFRHRADDRHFDDLYYEQGEFQFLRVFGFEPSAGGFSDEQITQDLGAVTCREGRLLTFPNTLQHRVSAFSLSDRSKPGHRKILALFLIDPSRRIISTANVPPQREDWCKEWKQSVDDVLGKRLPVELQNMVHKTVDFTPMTMDEAKEYRLKLMDERSLKSTQTNRVFETGSFSLCEH